MRTLLVGIAALLFTLAPHAALAQEGPVAARSEVDRTVMAIGDQVLLAITVDLARGYELLDPGVPRAIGDFEVVDILTVLQSRLANGTTRVQLRYLITAFELGEHRLPVIVVGYRGPSGQGQARTQGGFVITVRSVIEPGEDSGDIKPLKPPLEVPGATNDLLPRVVPVAVAALAIAVAAVLALRVRGRAPVIAEPTVPGPARRTLDELERIAQMRLPELGRTREHYELVSSAIRRFVAERYGVSAEARTARELRRELERAGLDRTQAQLLFEVLADAESVRYEELVIYPARAHKAMRDVLEVLRKRVVAEEYELVSSGATA